MPKPAPQSEGIDLAHLRTGLVIAMGLGLTVAVVVTALSGGQEVLRAVRGLPIGWFLLALSLSAASWLGQGLGFSALTRRGVRGNIGPMTTAFLGGDLAALMTPFGSGGIPAGVFCLVKEGLSAGEATAVIAVHSLLTGAFFVMAGIAAALTVPFGGGASSATVWGGIAAMVLGMGGLVWLIARPRKVTGALRGLLTGRLFSGILGRERAHRLGAAAEMEAEHFTRDLGMLMRERPVDLALSFAGLTFSRLCLVTALPVIMYGLGWRGDVGPMLATAVGALALAIVSPSPGGSGAVEAATTALLATQTTAPIAVAASLLWRGVTYYAEVLAGWLALSRYLAISNTKTPAPEK